jgi:hypothetical protein
MTDRTWPPRPPDRLRHSWRCTRRSPIVETIRRDPIGRAQIVAMCTECDGTDLDDRLRSEREVTP